MEKIGKNKIIKQNRIKNKQGVDRKEVREENEADKRRVKK